jgi:protein-serine/threonine kinase
MLDSMMNWADGRLTVNQIKSHPFFFGADWNTIRQIEPPFIPRLQSITDTSYFPTDELELGGIPNHLDKAEPMTAEKDLAFLGYAILTMLAHCTKDNFSFTFKRFTGGTHPSG